MPIFLKPLTFHGTTGRKKPATYTVNFVAEKLLKYESGSPTQSPRKMDKIQKLHRTHQNTKCHFEKLRDTLILIEYGFSRCFAKDTCEEWPSPKRNVVVYNLGVIVSWIAVTWHIKKVLHPDYIWVRFFGGTWSSFKLCRVWSINYIRWMPFIWHNSRWLMNHWISSNQFHCLKWFLPWLSLDAYTPKN